MKEKINMIRVLTEESFCNIKDPVIMRETMRRDVKLLYDKKAYVTCTMVVLCNIDALAAGNGKATSGKFSRFVKKYFSELCSGLDSVARGKTGDQILYDMFRNGFAHLFSPKPGFAIAEDHELGGLYVDKVEVGASRKLVAINVDRLTKDFLDLIEKL